MKTITNYQMDFITGLSQMKTDFMFMSNTKMNKESLEKSFKAAADKVLTAFINAKHDISDRPTRGIE